MPLTLGLGFRLFGIDRLSPTLRRAGAAFREMGREAGFAVKQLRDTARQSKITAGDLLAVGAAAAGLGALVTKAAFDAGTFEQQMGFLRVVTGATTDELGRLERQALDMSTRFGVMPIDVAKTQVALARLGFQAGDLEKVLVPTLGTIQASMGKLGPDQAGKLIGQTLKSFGLDASKATLIADQMSTAVARTAIDYDKMGLAVGTAGGFVANFGGTTAEMLAFLGLAADVISRTERGATGMRNVFRDLADVQRQNKIQTQLGIEVVDQQTGKFKNITLILEELFKRFGDMTEAERQANIQRIFSQEAAGGLLALMKRLEAGIKDANGETLHGVAALRLLVGDVGKGTVTVKEFVDAALGPLPGQMAISRAALGKLAIAFGQVFGLILGPLIRMVTGLFEGLVWVVQKTGFFGKGLALVLGIVGVTIGLLGPPLISAALFMKLFGLGSLFATGGVVALTTSLIALFKVMVVVTFGLALIALAIGAIAKLMGAFDFDDNTKELEAATASLKDFEGAAGGKFTVGAARFPERADTSAGIRALQTDPDAVEAAGPLPSTVPGPVVPAAAGGDGAGDITINLNVDGKKLERVVVRASDRRRQRRFGAEEA